METVEESNGAQEALAKSESQRDPRLVDGKMANINVQSGSLYDEKHDAMASANEHA